MRKYDGELKLVMAQGSQGTVSETVYCTGNSKLSSTIFLDDEKIPCHFLISMGGGFIEGERYHASIELKDGARGIISSQAPTYVYKCEKNKVTTQRNEIELGENAILECLLDEVIPYRHAIFSQETVIKMTKSSTLFYSDGITAGWSPDEKQFQYKSVHMRTTVEMEGELVYLDNLYLAPKDHDMTQIGLFEGYSNLGTLVVIDESIDGQFIQSLRKEVAERHPTITFGISQLDVNGFILRALGQSSPELHQVIGECVDFSRGRIMQSPALALRKNTVPN